MRKSEQIIVAVWCGLSDHQLETKVYPICESSRVRKVIVFRRNPLETHPKMQCISPPKILRGLHALSLLWMTSRTIQEALKSRKSGVGSFSFAFGITAFPHGLLARLAGTIAGKKTGIWWIGTDLGRQLCHPLVGFIYKAFLRNCDLTLTMGSVSRCKLIGAGWPEYRTFAILNAHNLDRFYPDFGPKCWDIINVGRHDRNHKRLHILLQAISLVRHSIPNVSCVLVGDGPDRRRLKSLCKNLKINENVEFLGRRADVPNLLNRSRVFVMCSGWEGLPASMIEAFCCGIPVVTNNVNDIPDIAEDEKNSIIVKSDSPEEYATAIVRVLKDKNLYSHLHKGALEGRRRMESFNPAVKARQFWDSQLDKMIFQRS